MRRKKGSKSKDKSQYLHAARRSMQRYGINLSREKYSQLCSKIQEGENDECIFLHRQSNRVSAFAVMWESQWLPIIYDSNRHTVATILPPEALEEYKEKLGLESVT